MLQDYHKHKQLLSRVVSLDLQSSIRKGVRLLQAGVDGSVPTLKKCLLFFNQSLPQALEQTKGKSSIRKLSITNKRIDALIGVIGALLNGILLGGRGGNEGLFRKLLSKSVDLLDPNHLNEGISRFFTGKQRDNLKAVLMSGVSTGRRFVHLRSDRMWHEALSHDDGLVFVGICAGALGRTMENGTIKNEAQAGDESSVSSQSSSVTWYTVGTMTKHVFREDSFLSPQEEDLLILHKAVKYCDKKLVAKAIADATEAGTVNVVDSVGRTALDLAALTGQVVFFEDILKGGGTLEYIKTEKQAREILEVRSKEVDQYQKIVASKLNDGTIDSQSILSVHSKEVDQHIKVVASKLIDEGTIDTQSMTTT